LSHQKGFDLLIEAFARLTPKYPGWELRIIGEGTDRAALERLATERGVALRVRFCGWLNDPQPVLAGSELFVLSSRWEGFPNALLEAMACGVPAVSFDCDSGPSEIIRDRVDGLLVPPDDVSALASALDHLMDDAALRREMGDRAREVVTRFSCARFFAQWDNVVRGVLGEAP
jgi:GalNAc-alpha-(1->4)-GalNAc-alpha-(1->3)-diNAcBac-PP-undecaprenol alpha-1,4-N-acetyl-D-galactosaminyltransferase